MLYIVFFLHLNSVDVIYIMLHNIDAPLVVFTSDFGWYQTTWQSNETIR